MKGFFIFRRPAFNIFPIVFQCITSDFPILEYHLKSPWHIQRFQNEKQGKLQQCIRSNAALRQHYKKADHHWQYQSR